MAVAVLLSALKMLEGRDGGDAAEDGGDKDGKLIVTLIAMLQGSLVQTIAKMTMVGIMVAVLLLAMMTTRL